MVRCPRCNQYLERLNSQHTNACAIPIPVVLASEWLMAPTMTTKKLARIYDVHRDFMKNRLELGGIPAHLQAQRGYRIRRLNWGKVEQEEPAIPPEKATCKTCSLLIPANDIYCSFCKQELIDQVVKEISTNGNNKSSLPSRITCRTGGKFDWSRATGWLLGESSQGRQKTRTNVS